MRYVVIISQRYSPHLNVLGPFTYAEAQAWRDKIKGRVGALGRTWEWRIERIEDPADWEGQSVYGDWANHA